MPAPDAVVSLKVTRAWEDNAWTLRLWETRKGRRALLRWSGQVPDGPLDRLLLAELLVAFEESCAAVLALLTGSRDQITLR
jgi:hypothetical protein